MATHYPRSPIDVVIGDTTINLFGSSTTTTSSAVVSSTTTSSTTTPAVAASSSSSAAPADKSSSAAVKVSSTHAVSPVVASAAVNSASAQASTSNPVAAVSSNPPPASSTDAPVASTPTNEAPSATEPTASDDHATQVTNTVYEASSSSSAAAASAPAPSSSDLSTPGMVGIIIGCVVALMLLLSACFFIAKMRKRSDRKALADDALDGMGGVEWGRRASRRLSHTGYASTHHDHIDDTLEPLEAFATPHGYDITRPEARDSVQMQMYGAHVQPGHHGSGALFAPPHAPFGGYRGNDRSSGWTDNSEMDAFAERGSTIARTASTVTRGNSEYDLERDPGMVMMQAPGPAFHTHTSSPSNGTFGRSSPYTPRAPAPYNPYAPAAGSVLSVASGNSYPSAIANTAMAPSPLATQASRGSAYDNNRAQSVYDSRGSTYDTYEAYHSAADNSGRGQSYYETDAAVAAGGRIPAPRLLVDTKQAISQYEDSPSGAGPSAARPPTAMSVHSVHGARGTGAATPPTPVASSPASTLSGASVVRPLVSNRQQSMYVMDNEELADSPIQQSGASGRPATIVMHADSGMAFEDAEPHTDQEGNLHLPPAYGDIYGPPEPERR